MPQAHMSHQLQFFEWLTLFILQYSAQALSPPRLIVHWGNKTHSCGVLQRSVAVAQKPSPIALKLSSQVCFFLLT